MEPSRVFESTPKQLLATVAYSCMKKGRWYLKVGVFYVGEGLPPISMKLPKKILSGDYVEMEELLPEVCILEHDPPEPKHHC